MGCSASGVEGDVAQRRPRGREPSVATTSYVAQRAVDGLVRTCTPSRRTLVGRPRLLGCDYQVKAGCTPSSRCCVRWRRSFSTQSTAQMASAGTVGEARALPPTRRVGPRGGIRRRRSLRPSTALGDAERARDRRVVGQAPTEAVEGRAAAPKSRGAGHSTEAHGASRTRSSSGSGGAIRGVWVAALLAAGRLAHEHHRRSGRERQRSTASPARWRSTRMSVEAGLAAAFDGSRPARARDPLRHGLRLPPGRRSGHCRHVGQAGVSVRRDRGVVDLIHDPTHSSRGGRRKRGGRRWRA